MSGSRKQQEAVLRYYTFLLRGLLELFAFCAWFQLWVQISLHEKRRIKTSILRAYMVTERPYPFLFQNHINNTERAE